MKSFYFGGPAFYKRHRAQPRVHTAWKETPFFLPKSRDEGDSATHATAWRTQCSADTQHHRQIDVPEKNSWYDYFYSQFLSCHTCSCLGYLYMNGNTSSNTVSRYPLCSLAHQSTAPVHLLNGHRQAAADNVDESFAKNNHRCGKITVTESLWDCFKPSSFHRISHEASSFAKIFDYLGT